MRTSAGMTLRMNSTPSVVLGPTIRRLGDNWATAAPCSWPTEPTSDYNVPTMRKGHTLRPRSSRHRIRIPCQVVRMRDFKLVADSIENLSLGGILVGPSDPVLTGEPLYLSFRLPRSGQWIDTDAVVARVIHGRREGDHTRQLGVRFDALPSEARNAIRQQLAECSAPAADSASWAARHRARLAPSELGLGLDPLRRGARAHALVGPVEGHSRRDAGGPRAPRRDPIFRPTRRYADTTFPGTLGHVRRWNREALG